MSRRIITIAGALILSAALALSACTPSRDIKIMKKRTAPDWVSGFDDDYDNKDYLTGVGQGDTKAVAETQAYALLLKNITVERRLDKTLPLALNVRWSKAVDDDLRKILARAKIEERWQDETARTFALAVVKRPELSQAITQRITELEAKIDLQKEAFQIDDSISGVENLRRFLKVAPLLYVREVLLQEVLPVVDGVAINDKDKKSYPEVEETLEALTKRIAIRVDLAGSGSETVKDVLFEDLNRSKLRMVGTAEARTDFILKGAVSSAQVDNDDPSLQWLRSEVNADLIDGKNQQVFGKIRQSDRQGAKQMDKAERAALQHLGQALAEDLNARLIEFLEKG